MAARYEIFMPERGGKSVLRHEETGVAYIPFDDANSDYQRYLLDTDGGLPLPKETI